MGFDIGKTLGDNLPAAVGNLLAPGLQDAAGAFGIGGKKYAMPTLQHAELDPIANDILNQRAARASLTSDAADKQIVGEQNKFIDEPGGLLTGGGVDSPMQAALQARQSREHGSLTNKMRRSDSADSGVVQGQRTASTLGAIRNDSLNAINFAQKQKMAEQNKKFARNNAINQIFRSGGALAGAAIGTWIGGPEGGKAGAAGGSAAGSGIGNTVGGQTGDLQYI